MRPLHRQTQTERLLRMIRVIWFMGALAFYFAVIEPLLRYVFAGTETWWWMGIRIPYALVFGFIVPWVMAVHILGGDE